MKRKVPLMSLAVLLLILTLFIASSAVPDVQAVGPAVFINEIHYDNASTDAGEGFEVAGPAGTDLTGWNLVLYNGNGGASYGTISLFGTIADQQAGFGTLAFNLPTDGLQNGSPDGLALVDAGSAVVEFLSYEGSFVAAGGPANGMASTDIGVSESSSTPVGDSLQLTGNGTMGGDFTWASSAGNTFGDPNTGQTFGGFTADPVINEFVANHTGSDTNAFVEVLGSPSSDYSTFTILEIEGDFSSSGIMGTIDAALPVGTTNGGGYWIDPEDMENGTITILLVEGFSGSQGDDLDSNNDGTFDSTPWTRIVDDVATTDGGGSDLTYSATVLGPFFDGNPFGAGGASRIPNGSDTDATADWARNDFDGYGFPGFIGSPSVGEAVNTPEAVNEVITVPTDPFGKCGDAATLIHAVQGSGASSPDVGSIRALEGVVVGDFEGSSELRGFFLQEEDSDVDGDPNTSEGIFIYNDSFGPGVNPGEVVRVRGTVTEHYGLTEINNVTDMAVCSPYDTASPATLTLPVGSLDEWERVEGMQITIPHTLYASGNYTQGQYGEVDLSVNAPLDNPTNVVAPGAAAQVLAELNGRSRIQLDDGSTVSNPLPLPPYLAPDNTLRTGDTIPSLTGALGFAFGSYEIHPTEPVSFTRENARTDAPEVGGSINVAAYNVLNYFTTLDNAGAICGPLGDQGCRGADNAFEFAQQKEKLVDAISKLDADIVGLMEIENYPGDVPIADLVAGINSVAGVDTYDYIATGAIGTDAIRVGILYKPASVTPEGAFAILDSGVDAAFDDTKNRPVLAQTFLENGTNDVVTVAVNHLKSKGSPCDGDPDIGDGQGNCNNTRTVAAQALVDWLATDPTDSGNGQYLITGDLNAYAMEDPVTTIEAAAYTDLIEMFAGSGWANSAYSYNFFSQSGYLDHGLASPALLPRVTGASFWHVNADEPSALNYNDYNQPLLFNPDEFRSSDHDPVVVGICETTAPVVTATASPDTLWPPNHKYVDVTVTVDVTDADENPTIVFLSATSNEADNAKGRGDGNTINDIVIVDDFNFQLRAERSGTGNGRIYTITYEVTDGCGNRTIATAEVSVPKSRKIRIARDEK